VVPVVVVDVVPADAPADQAKIMIDACSQAVRREGSCALSSSSPESTRPESIALVIWQGGDSLHVSIRVSRGDGEWASRQLDFSAADAMSDRWTAVGLTVATLVDETRSDGAQGAAPAPDASAALPSSAPKTVDSATSAAPSTAPRLALSAGGLVGTGWDDGGAKRGFWASAMAGWPNTPLFGIASAGYAWSDGPELAGSGALASRWLDVSLGVGLEAILRPVRLRVFAAPEIVLQFVTAKPAASDAALHDREARLRMRAGLAWPADGHVGVTLGGTARLLPISTDDAAPNHARTSRIAAELFGGIELRL
jgi:hypothetical protein